ncbi:hypothetical protein JKP75_19485 [Blastococcus sp. TML/M2B]|nr:hypothetical protein [Blastococcus sp. TML/M2B]MBN1094530.1 hypothetical protein [Blastococcus sp. TML/M2B]
MIRLTTLGTTKAEERDHARGDQHRRGDDRDHHHADGDHPPVVQAEVGGELLAQADDAEPVGGDPGDDDHRPGDPQELVAALHDRGEAALGPLAQRLQQVQPVGDERGDRGDDAAEHDPDQRHQHQLAHRHDADHPQEHPGADQAEDGGDAHLPDDGQAREEHDRDEHAEGGELADPGGARLHELVAHEHLHDQPGDAERGTDEEHRQGARDAAGDEQEGRVAVGVPAEHRQRRHVGDPDEQAEDGEDGEQHADEHPHPRAAGPQAGEGARQGAVEHGHVGQRRRRGGTGPVIRRSAGRRRS